MAQTKTEVLLFDAPSGKVRGVVTAFILIEKNGKEVEVRIAHATLLTDSEPTVATSLPASLPLSALPDAGAELRRFAAKVMELDKPRTEPVSEEDQAWYRNQYECPRCGTEWEDQWSCGCDDECPDCGLDCSPVTSEEIGAA
jgi:hypothetical protein